MKEIKTGDLIVYKSSDKFDINNIFSYAVKYATFSRMTHVGIALVEDGRVYIVEALIPKVRKVLLTDIEDIYVINFDRDISNESINRLKSYIGKEYSIPQAIGSLIGYSKVDDMWFCTELAWDWYVNYLGLTVKKRLVPGDFIYEVMKLPNATQRLILKEDLKQ